VVEAIVHPQGDSRLSSRSGSMRSFTMTGGEALTNELTNTNEGSIMKCSITNQITNQSGSRINNQSDLTNRPAGMCTWLQSPVTKYDFKDSANRKF